MICSFELSIMKERHAHFQNGYLKVSIIQVKFNNMTNGHVHEHDKRITNTSHNQDEMKKNFPTPGIEPGPPA